jgi:hypothetical protein
MQGKIFIVRVKESKIFSGSKRTSEISGCRSADILREIIADSFIPSEKWLNDLTGIIGRSVVNDYQFPIFEILRYDALHSTSNKTNTIESWQDDGKLHTFIILRT